jgi:tRNA(Ile)-lysidine synthase TilS/MesJ
LLTTFFMNLCQNGRVDGMTMREPFFKGKLMVIRPLMLVEKATITRAARAWDLPVWKNPCPSSGTTRRASIMEDIDRLCAGHKDMRATIVAGLCRWQLGLTRKDAEDTP